MIKIAKSVEYAIFALKYIHETSDNEYRSAKEISMKLSIPYELLAKILQKLVRNGIVNSQQGSSGGYVLIKKPGEISLSDIIFATGEKVQLTNCLHDNPKLSDCVKLSDCCLRSPLGKIQDKVNYLFEKTTLLELIN